MKIYELIEKLKEMPQDAMAIVSGYEGGVNEVDEVEQCMIELNANSAWYYGKHEIVNKEGVSAVIIR